MWKAAVLRRAGLIALAAGAMVLAAACGGQSGSGTQGSAAATSASCPSASFAGPAKTYVASGDHLSGQGLDVTAVASLDPQYGVNGTIDVAVTVACPTGVTDVAVFQSYQAWGSTVGTNLSEIAHSGNTWSFALFADNLSGQEPFQVALYQGALSGSGKPALATIFFKWPASLVKDMAS